MAKQPNQKKKPAKTGPGRTLIEILEESRRLTDQSQKLTKRLGALADQIKENRAAKDEKRKREK